MLSRRSRGQLWPRKDSIMNMLAEALKECKNAPITAKGGTGGKGSSISSIVIDTAKGTLTMVVSGVSLNYERGTRIDQATKAEVPNSSIKLLQIGKGNFGCNVSGVSIDGTKVRCNTAFRLNLSNEQHAKDSDIILA